MIEEKELKLDLSADCKQTLVPDDVICEYQSQVRGEKNKEIYLGSPGNNCQKEIVCPKK